MIAIELATDELLKLLVDILDLRLIGHLPSPQHNVKVFMCPFEELKQVGSGSIVLGEYSKGFDD